VGPGPALVEDRAAPGGLRTGLRRVGLASIHLSDAAGLRAEHGARRHGPDPRHLARPDDLLAVPGRRHRARLQRSRRLDRAVSACATPPVLVAHSLGCILVAHWAGRTRGRAGGALLLAPVDLDAAANLVDTVDSFRPVPLVRLPFRSVVVASDDDPYTTAARAEKFARGWGSRFVAVHGAGHINSDSGYGEWPQGRALLDELAGPLAPARPSTRAREPGRPRPPRRWSRSPLRPPRSR